MKNPKIIVIIAALGLCSAVMSLSAQGTAFTYQGRLNDGVNPANGSYDLTFTLFTTNTGGSVFTGPITNSATAVSNGLFTAMLDFGAGVFTGPARWLEIGVRTNGGTTFATLAPRQSLTPAAYAIMANSASNLLGSLSSAQLSGTIPSANLSGAYGNPVNFNNGANGFDGTFVGTFFGGSFTGGNFNGNFFGNGGGLFNLDASQLASGTVPDAQLAGNVAFLNSNQTFTAQNVFSQGIGIGNPNPSPFIAIDALAGQANARFVTTNNPNGAVIELNNQTTNLYSSYLGAINFNNASNTYPGQIGYFVANPTNQNNDYMQFRVGGAAGALTLQGDPRGEGISSLIGGSGWNSVDPSSGGNVIAGGGFPGGGNIVYSNSYGVFIGAGSINHIGPNVDDSVIAGGYGHTIQSVESAIGGGLYNTIQTGANDSTIAGGDGNVIQTNATDSVIAGGLVNTIQVNASYDAIGGGYNNSIQTNTIGSVISGGYQNTIGSNATTSVIGGGFQNTIVEGGSSPFIALGSTIGGGIQNTIQANAFNSTIAGGNGNVIQTNAAGDAIGGGSDNQVGASGAVVPGGFGNVASGIQSFAAGTQAQATNNGAFVLTDDETTNFYSTASNQLSARFTGGIVFVTAGAGMTLDGQPILAGSNGTGLTNVNAALLNGLSSNAFAAANGSTNYIQNQSAGPQNASFNIRSNATIGGTVTANTLIVSNSLQIAGNGVFRVANAGVGTSTAAFVQYSAASNILSSDSTYINNPLCNGDPNAILIITHNYDPGGTGAGPNTVYNKVVGVWYNGSQWAIYNEDQTSMQSNLTFNVLIIKH